MSSRVIGEFFMMEIITICFDSVNPVRRLLCPSREGSHKEKYSGNKVIINYDKGKS
jgi:hypothetical protein